MKLGHKRQLANFRSPRQEAPAHLDFIRSLPCMVPTCRAGGRNHAAHLRMGSAIHGKRETGAGEKPSDKWTLPLCPEHHVFGGAKDGPGSQHSRGERVWWRFVGLDPIVLAALLWTVTGNISAGRSIVFNALEVAPCRSL